MTILAFPVLRRRVVRTMDRVHIKRLLLDFGENRVQIGCWDCRSGSYLALVGCSHFRCRGPSLGRETQTAFFVVTGTETGGRNDLANKSPQPHNRPKDKLFTFSGNSGTHLILPRSPNPATMRKRSKGASLHED